MAYRWMAGRRSLRERWPARRLLVYISIAAIVLLVGGVVLFPFVTVREEADLPTDLYDLSYACSFPGIAYVKAAAYEGPAPHPVKLPNSVSSYGLKDLPPAWRPDSVAEVQLIACAHRVEGDGERGFSKSCQYQPEGLVRTPDAPSSRVSMRQGTYKVTLYELRTHRKVAQTTLIGRDDTCPASITSSRRTGFEEIYTELTATQYVEAFSSYVEK